MLYSKRSELRHWAGHAAAGVPISGKASKVEKRY